MNSGESIPSLQEITEPVSSDIQTVEFWAVEVDKSEIRNVLETFKALYPVLEEVSEHYRVRS